ncbi:OmpA family protein [Roseivivax sp. CAU 1761]
MAEHRTAYARATGAALALATLAACGEAGRDPVFTAFHREAGSVIDPSDLGQATRTNMAAMKARDGHAVNLARRFAAEVDSTVTFDFNSAALTPEARAVLLRQADFIRQFPELRFRVYGHTDLVGSDAYNRALGEHRAQAVVAFLGSQGIALSRLEALVSFGETRPLIVTEGRERRNRRTVTEVSGFVDGHPNVLDGKYAQIVYREYVASAVPASGLSGDPGGSGAGGTP